MMDVASRARVDLDGRASTGGMSPRMRARIAAQLDMATTMTATAREEVSADLCNRMHE
jgi:hypothetical protein